MPRPWSRRYGEVWGWGGWGDGAKALVLHVWAEGGGMVDNQAGWGAGR